MFERCNETGDLLRPPKMGRPVPSEGRVGCIFYPTATQPAGSRWGAVIWDPVDSQPGSLSGSSLS